MFIDRLLNQGNLPLLEQSVKFAARRHELIAENIANLSTPGYRQKDLDVGAFQEKLRERVAERSVPGTRISSVRFEGIAEGVEEQSRGGLLFHDGTNRSAEDLMTDLAKNALTHNLQVEFLRRQFSSIDSALKERVS